MERIYHTYDKWECFPAGLYESTPPKGMCATEANGAYALFLKDSARFARQFECEMPICTHAVYVRICPDCKGRVEPVKAEW